MGRSEYLIRIVSVSLLVFALTISGCGIITGDILRASHEHAEIESFCARRCSELKGDDYAKCHKACVHEEEKRRSEEKARKEADRKELEKRFARDNRK